MLHIRFTPIEIGEKTMDKEGCLLSTRTILIIIVLGVALIIGGTIFEILYNNTLAIPVQNSERNVQTCSQQYLVTQKTHIENELEAIASNKREASQTNDKATLEALKEQNQASADAIYNALDSSQCSRSQIIKDMPELQGFFDQYSR